MMRCESSERVHKRETSVLIFLTGDHVDDALTEVSLQPYLQFVQVPFDATRLVFVFPYVFYVNSPVGRSGEVAFLYFGLPLKITGNPGLAESYSIRCLNPSKFLLFKRMVLE